MALLVLPMLSSGAGGVTLPVTTAPQTDARLPVHKAFVLGKDSRTAVPKKYKALTRAMGVLYKPKTKAICSAFCVAPDVIATAAHCALSGKKGSRLPDLAQILFFRYLPERRKFSRATVANGYKDMIPRNMLVGTPITRAFQTSLKGQYRDWALVKLKYRSCARNVLSVRVASSRELFKASRQKKIFQLAFHGDRSAMKIPAYSTPCRILNVSAKKRQAPKVLQHDCDMVGGSSGSPIFMETPKGPVVIGVNIAGISRQKVLRRGKKIVKWFRKKPRYNSAVNVRAFAAKIEHLSKADIFFGTPKLVELQKALLEKKLYRSKADGIYGPGVRAAIVTWQKKTGATADGFPSDTLLEGLVKVGEE